MAARCAVRMFMEGVSLRAYAKINIGLDITGKREDGYHLLKTCMQTISLHDVITVSKAEDAAHGIKVTSDSALVPEDETNTAFRAARLAAEEYGIKDGLRIDIKKNIPVGAGLAGGSADAAAVIKAVDALFGLSLSEESMDALAVKLGADVPFCLRSGLWLCEGIGEILTRLPALTGVCAVIVKPPFAVSTAWCYAEFDRLKEVSHPDMEGLVRAVREGSNSRVFEKTRNILEAATCPAHPEIEEIKSLLLENGAKAACMSGSGSAVFGLFTDRKKAEAARTAFKTYPAAESVFAADFASL